MRVRKAYFAIRFRNCSSPQSWSAPASSEQHGHVSWNHRTAKGTAMRRAAFVLMSIGCSLAPVGAVHAGATGPPPLFSVQLAQAEAVVVGKVTALEDKSVAASRDPEDREKVECRIAVVKIEESLVGSKDRTHVRVGRMP